MLIPCYKRSVNFFSYNYVTVFLQSIHMKHYKPEKPWTELKVNSNLKILHDRVFHHHVSPCLPPPPARVSALREGDLAKEYCETERCYFGGHICITKDIQGYLQSINTKCCEYFPSHRLQFHPLNPWKTAHFLAHFRFIDYSLISILRSFCYLYLECHSGKLLRLVHFSISS